MFLSDLSIKQPVLATMLAVSLVTLGVFSYRELAIDQFPDVEIPVLTVQTIYPGASPETVEREVTKRVEEALNTISGVRHISSTTTEGLSAIVVEFRLGTRINNAQQDAQAKINSIRAEFPRDMKEPVIQRIDLNAMPIISIAVESSSADLKTLSSIGEKVIKKRLETVSGVGQVNLVGVARREIQIILDRDKLKSFKPHVRPGAAGIAAREPGRAGGQAGTGPRRAPGARGRQDSLRGGVRPPGGSRTQRKPYLPAHGGAHGRWHRGAPQRFADRRQAGPLAGRGQTIRRQYRTTGRRSLCRSERTQRRPAVSHPAADSGGPVHFHPRIGGRREGDAGPGRASSP